ncbi:MAG: DUF2279 domain-containing protein [Bacteroidota bacterium]
MIFIALKFRNLFFITILFIPVLIFGNDQPDLFSNQAKIKKETTKIQFLRTGKNIQPIQLFNHSEEKTDEDFFSNINRSRLSLVSAVHVVGYSSSLLVLNEAWYKNYPRSSFHFHNDWPQWMQMDKAGHVFSAYQLTRYGHYSFRWAGVDQNRSALWSSISGSLFLTTIEILDGLSTEWGASVSDFTANTLGSFLFAGQQIFWQEQKIILKYSYGNSEEAKYRPDLLGVNLPERILKDYNGMRIWVSANPGSFITSQNILPPWFNISLGYGASGLLGGITNPEVFDNIVLPDLHRHRRFFLSPDVDLSRINTPYPFINKLLTTINIIKIPAPALEYNTEQGFVFHWILF